MRTIQHIVRYTVTFDARTYPSECGIQSQQVWLPVPDTSRRRRVISGYLDFFSDDNKCLFDFSL